MSETKDKNAPKDAPVEKVTPDKEKAASKAPAAPILPYVGSNPNTEPLTGEQYEQAKADALAKQSVIDKENEKHAEEVKKDNQKALDKAAKK